MSTECVRIPVTESMKRLAVFIRQARDTQFSNRFDEKATDIRWGGDLGELAMSMWLDMRNARSVWNLIDPLGKADFDVGAAGVELKTSKRAKRMKPEYICGVPGAHFDKLPDEIFFACYEVEMGTICLCGGMPVETFKQASTFYEYGERTHVAHTVRNESGMHYVKAMDLESPNAWLERVTAGYTSTFAKPGSR